LNNAAKAVTYLEAALAQGDPDERLLLDLGLAYQKVGQGADARKVFRQGADLNGPARKTFLLDLGVASYLAKDWPAAEAAYTEALADDPAFAQALLNRAHTRLNAADLAGAAADYRAYQAAVPANPQKDKIDQVLGLLDQAVLEAQATQLAEATRKKKQEDEAAAAAAAAEAKRQADEAAAKAEEEKAAAAAAEAQRQADEAAAAEKAQQEAILAKIRESLAGASGDSQALSTGPSGVKADSGDFSLDN
jgi:lipoprotein NlpI